jgi:translocation and assembly module TamB
VTGRVALEGLPDQVPLRLDVRLEAGGGIIAVAGTVDLRGPEPVYDVTGRIIGLDMQRVLEPAFPPAQLHAGFALAGRGVTLPTATATLRMDGRFAGWRAAPGDTLVLDVRLAEGLVVAQQSRVDLGPIHVSAAGEWRFANGEGGAIRYALQIESLEPLAPYLPRPEGRPLFARGALAAEGTLAGTLEVPLLSGTVRASDFRYGDWAARRLEGDYEVRLGPGLPQVVADVTATDLRTPGGDFQDASLVLDFTRPAFALQFHGDRTAGLGLVAIEADGLIDDVGVSEVVLRTVELDLDRQRWRLPAPARLERSPGDVIHVTGLRLEQVEGPGLVQIDGIVAPADLTDLHIQVAVLPVGDLIGLIRADLAVAGDLWLDGTLRGPAASPTLDADVQLMNGSIRDVEIERLRAHVRYENHTLTAVGDGLFAEMANFEILAVLPMELELGIPPRVELIGDAPIRGELHTQDFALAALDPAIPTVRDLEGRVTANVLLAGTPTDPILSGGATLRDGAVTVRLLNQRYEGIEGEATLSEEVLRVDRLVAHSDGTATLAGTIRFEDLANPVLDLVAEFQRFRAQGVQGRQDAAMSGRLAIGGTPTSPLLSGNLRVEDGTLDMTRLQPPGSFSDEVIGVAERFAPLGPDDGDLLEPAETLVRISRLDLTAGDDLWFQSDEFRIQLTGNLIVQKPDQDVMILGTLTGTRGTFSLRVATATRRFDIVDANIQFFGTPGPDPALDITASRIIPGPDRTDFELRIRLTGSLTSPAIAFATEDGTTIPEAEALNFLIFGRATATLADFPGAGLGTVQTALDAFAFYGGFDWVSAAVAEQFGAGIDYFQILVRTGTGEVGPELSFLLGHEVVDDIFVLVTLPTTEFEARWALTGEWRIDRQWTLEAGYEPPDLVIGIPGRRLPFGLEREQQLFVSIRRRWSY